MSQQNDNNTGLMDYLKDHRIHKEDKKIIKATHTGLPGYQRPGTYYVSDDDLDELHDLMHEHVFINNQPLHLTETQNYMDNCIYMDDIDIKQSLEQNPNATHTYSKSDIVIYCTESMKILSSLFELYDEQKYIYVLVKESPTNLEGSDLVKDGWHIMVPELVIPFKYLREARNKRMINKEILNIFGNMNLNMNIKDIIDGTIYKKGSWFTYGSTKPDSKPYQLKYVFKYTDDTLVEIDISNDTESNDKNIITDPRFLIDLFSLRNKKEKFVLK
jgi:hypothetical protein